MKFSALAVVTLTFAMQLHGSSDLGILKRIVRPASGVYPTEYEVSVTNYGPDAAGAMTVKDVLPPGMLFDADFFTGPWPAPWDCTFDSSEAGPTAVACTHPGPLAVGSTATLPMKMWAPPGLYDNCATVSQESAGGDPDSANNRSCTCTLVTECRGVSVDISTGTSADWRVVATPSGPADRPATVVGKYNSAFVDAAPANWISAAGPQPEDPGEYVYELKFTFGSERYLDCAASFDYASDNDVTFLIDGVPIAQTAKAGTSAFTKLRTRRVHLFPIPGPHTLRARVSNVDGPTSLLVRGSIFCTCYFFIDFVLDDEPSPPYEPVPSSWFTLRAGTRK